MAVQLFVVEPLYRDLQVNPGRLLPAIKQAIKAKMNMLNETCINGNLFSEANAVLPFVAVTAVQMPRR
jgi:hypothetical protein